MIGCLLAIGHAELAAQSNVHSVLLSYNAPGEGPEPEHTGPFVVDFCFVQRADETEPMSVIRCSRRSWRSGSITINGVPALVAAMDGNNDALYGPGDTWSVIEASMPEASEQVLSFREARGTDRFMLLQRGNGEADIVAAAAGLPARRGKHAMTLRSTLVLLARCTEDGGAHLNARPPHRERGS